MDFETSVAVCAGAFCLKRQKKKKDRRLWSKKWFLDRSKFSHMSLLAELAISEPQDFKNYLRMSEESFEYLFGRLCEHIEKEDSLLRTSIPAKERLAATLQFLASGRSYENLKFSCAISPQALGKIIPETCAAIFDVLKEDFLKFPCNESDWMNIAVDFKKYWQVENCIGAIDGKHIAIRQPPKSGSYYYNYKGFHSIVLFAVVNANYEFIYVNCGTNGRVSDGGVLMETDFGELLENKELHLPSPTSFDDRRDVCLPFTFLGDEAFPLKENLMKPYPNKGITHDEKIFNYRMCRARRVVENAFGILATRFRVLLSTMNVSVERAEIIVLACCTLHNFLRQKSPTYLTQSSVDWEDTSAGQLNEGEWRQNTQELLGFKRMRRDGREQSIANAVRGWYKSFYNNEGSVDFQEKMINKR
ncbi:putative nuclease HARBI1 [Homalodisca vitripennis]|nr:putative nuclease HARBI1 [Homalodisca vitripennis]